VGDFEVATGGGVWVAAGDESHRVRKVDANGIITTIAGNGKIEADGYGGFSGDGGPATEARLNYPNEVIRDSVGNIYIADVGNYRIRKVDTSGAITTVAGNGLPGFSGDGGPATQALLNYPWAIAVDSADNLYITDNRSHRIRKVDASGIITTVAGNGSPGFSGDGGPATQAQLSSPSAVLVDSTSNIFIADAGNYRIRKVNTSGVITTVAGNGLRESSGDGRTAALASVFPGDLAQDSGGTMYVIDFGADNIRRIAKPGILVQSGESGDITFADENGLGYIMSSSGVHKSTIDLATREALLNFSHNTADQLVSITDRFGNQTTIQRDSAGKPLSITSPDGIVTTLFIDETNRLAQVSCPDDSYYSFGYTSVGLLTDVYDRRGSLFVHHYNADGRVVDVIDPEGGTWNYSRLTDSAGNAFSEILTGENNLVSYQDQTASTGAYTSVKVKPTGEVESITRTAEGLAETTLSSCGMNESRKYNLDTQYLFKYLAVADTTTPAGLKLASAFSRNYLDNNSDKVPDLITDLVSTNNRTWTTTNNTLAGVRTSTSPEGRSVTAEYDPRTLLTQRTSVPGLLPTTFEYDTRGRLISTTTGIRTTTVVYDQNGYFDYITTPDNKLVDYGYDLMGRLLSETRPDGSQVDYQYNANGNVLALSNPNEARYGFDYTANNQRKNFVQPLGGTYEYSYDLDRRLKAVVLPSGETITNIYAEGNLATTTTSEGVTSYDYLCGSLLGSAERNGERVSFGYDGPLVMSDTRTGTLAEAISYTYNNDFAVTSVTYAGATTSLGYDADGLLTKAEAYTISRNGQNGLPESLSGLGLMQSRSFNGYGELDGVASAVGGGKVFSWSVPTRDNAGRIIRREEYVDGNTVSWEYSYNAIGRLVQVKRNGVAVESYTYDANGNRLSEENALRGIPLQSYGLSAEDHVLNAGSVTYQFNVNGYLKSKTAADGTTAYDYSSRGELLRVEKPDGTILSYVHDPFGRRIAKQVNGATIEKYLWKDQVTLLAVYDGSDHLLQRYTYADARVPVSMTAGGTTYFLLTDQVGTLRAVADTAGTIVKKIDYDSFGNIIADSNPSFSVPFGFAGGLHDRDTGLVRFGYRDYSPELGRFVAKDPIDFAGGDTNLYAYVMNNPVNFTDSLGLVLDNTSPVPVTIKPEEDGPLVTVPPHACYNKNIDGAKPPAWNGDWLKVPGKKDWTTDVRINPDGTPSFFDRGSGVTLLPDLGWATDRLPGRKSEPGFGNRNGGWK
jgi:RHS repeat-associated protein